MERGAVKRPVGAVPAPEAEPMAARCSDYLAGSADVLRQASAHGLDERVEAAIAAIAGALARGRPLLVCGNGSSAADALRIVAELVGRFALERAALPALALGANPAALTGWANDYDFDSVYARQVQAYGQPGAVLLGLSTSGNSKNVVAAFEAARACGMTTVALTGQGGGHLAAHCDILLDVPSRSTPRIQEVHVCLYHFICQQVEARCAAASA
jgi:D-sedoheptulose 7-phosphate isomerase